ncbi:MAG: translation initiation factor IF-3 [Deltaproteobacteria bacterium]|nr:translation initiation factor IF-3 [Deltaproteobacteria bacterium]
MPQNRGPRINRQIRISPIRLIDGEGNQVGIIETYEAMKMAEESGLDLVEVSPQARPPVCKLMDYGRHKYEKNRQERAQNKKTADNTPKEIRFRPNTDTHDLEVKIGKARKFLENGSKVRMTVRFRGSEMRRQDVGRATLRKATEMLKDIGKLENSIPEMNGRMLSVTMAPAAPTKS